MMLYIMRHGAAEQASAEIEDRDRRLTARSRTKVREAAAGMRALKVAFDLILTSPFARAAETADIVAAESAGAPKAEPAPKLAGGIPAAEILASLRGVLEKKNVLIVGHEPALSQLASLLLTGSTEAMRIRLKPGGCVALELEEGSHSGGAQLRWMLTQRQLRRAGR
jgi:phosphohistidine phosphatase